MPDRSPSPFLPERPEELPAPGAHRLAARQWLALAAGWIVVAALFGALYGVAQRAILNEIRAQAMGTAIAVAAGIPPAEPDAIRQPADRASPAFQRVQEYITRVSMRNPDIRYIYVMRQGPAPATFEYVVDERERDSNDNGRIDRVEQEEPIGQAYDAAALPRMQEGWEQPTADDGVTPDPPYPDLLSGYAPIKDAGGRTVAMVGVDVTAGTVAVKLWTVRAAILAAGLALGGLLTAVIWLYSHQALILGRNRQLSQELFVRNKALNYANEELAALNQHYEEELKLARSVQLGFLPKTFPRHRKLAFDKCFMTCAILGGDLYDAFSLDAEHVAVLVADVSGHGASAALISGLLKMAVETLKQEHGHLPPAEQPGSVLWHPDQFLQQLNAMLHDEIPEYQFVTLIYAVLDLDNQRCRVGNAGHPFAIAYQAATRDTAVWSMPTGPALGFFEGSTYAASEWPVRSGDKILFYSDGLTEAMNPAGDEFGEEQLCAVLREHGDQDPDQAIKHVMAAVEAHRGPREMADDFTMILVQMA